MSTQYLKLDGYKDYPRFQIKFVKRGSDYYDFELSCKCKIQVPDIRIRDRFCMGTLMDDIYCVFMDTIAAVYKGTLVTKEESLWNDPDFRPARHLFCSKDKKLTDHVGTFIKRRRRMLIKKQGPVEGRNCSCCLFGNDHMQAKMHTHLFMNTVFEPTPQSSPDRSNEFKRLPKSVKKVVLCAPKLDTPEEKKVEDTAINKDQQVKREKKFVKKKPNQGKAPNNIRKTKKPPRL
ncbi:Oidioi.mRNA.OKI2018_I69.XSR.g13992.t1.cds [Oikopleura dioica]|uniref:Oidioi.mRNA.OKI2018_I69.XSR.g13992.t1.cds n=1 Tax=Oikopleura dioica TaxID=34765 RepID=A0ABN7S8J9_OIKDI|nr:Oidioi.mRNA.OKI2018_I69.XSR.g13992.t1.cds [Oikopleura dioica]